MRTQTRMNLFTADLESITWADVEAFLRLTDPPDERPREGTRLEYKSQVTNELPKHVAAMGNASGGVLLIGVESADDVPIAMPGVPPKGEIGDQIIAKLHSAIEPMPPEFEVQPLAGPGGQHAAIIRVRPGGASMFRNKFPVRRGSQTQSATHREVRDLLADAMQTASRRHVEAESFALQLAFPDGPKTECVVRTALIPHRRVASGRMSSEAEREILREIGELFFLDDRVHRGGDRVDLLGVGSPTSLRSCWRAHADGRIASMLDAEYHPNPGTVFLYDLCEYVLYQLFTMGRIARRVGAHGTADIVVHSGFSPNAKWTPASFRRAGHRVTSVQVNGRGAFGKTEFHPYVCEVDLSALVDPVECAEIAEGALWHQLREMAGAEISVRFGELIALMGRELETRLKCHDD